MNDMNIKPFHDIEFKGQLGMVNDLITDGRELQDSILDNSQEHVGSETSMSNAWKDDFSNNHSEMSEVRCNTSSFYASSQKDQTEGGFCLNERRLKSNQESVTSLKETSVDRGIPMNNINCTLVQENNKEQFPKYQEKADVNGPPNVSCIRETSSVDMIAESDSRCLGPGEAEDISPGTEYKVEVDTNCSESSGNKDGFSSVVSHDLKANSNCLRPTQAKIDSLVMECNVKVDSGPSQAEDGSLVMSHDIEGNSGPSQTQNVSTVKSHHIVKASKESNMINEQSHAASPRSEREKVNKKEASATKDWRGGDVELKEIILKLRELNTAEKDIFNILSRVITKFPHLFPFSTSDLSKYITASVSTRIVQNQELGLHSSARKRLSVVSKMVPMSSRNMAMKHKTVKELLAIKRSQSSVSSLVTATDRKFKLQHSGQPKVTGEVDPMKQCPPAADDVVRELSEYVCNVCMRSFNRKSKLDYHMKSHSKKVESDADSDKDLDEESSRGEDQMSSDDDDDFEESDVSFDSDMEWEDDRRATGKVGKGILMVNPSFRTGFPSHSNNLKNGQNVTKERLHTLRQRLEEDGSQLRQRLDKSVKLDAADRVETKENQNPVSEDGDKNESHSNNKQAQVDKISSNIRSVEPRKVHPSAGYEERRDNSLKVAPINEDGTQLSEIQSKDKETDGQFSGQLHSGNIGKLQGTVDESEYGGEKWNTAHPVHQVVNRYKRKNVKKCKSFEDSPQEESYFDQVSSENVQISFGGGLPAENGVTLGETPAAADDQISFESPVNRQAAIIVSKFEMNPEIASRDAEDESINRPHAIISGVDVSTYSRVATNVESQINYEPTNYETVPLKISSKTTDDENSDHIGGMMQSKVKKDILFRQVEEEEEEEERRMKDVIKAHRILFGRPNCDTSMGPLSLFPSYHFMNSSSRNDTVMSVKQEPVEEENDKIRENLSNEQNSLIEPHCHDVGVPPSGSSSANSLSTSIATNIRVKEEPVDFSVEPIPVFIKSDVDPQNNTHLTFSAFQDQGFETVRSSYLALDNLDEIASEESLITDGHNTVERCEATDIVVNDIILETNNNNLDGSETDSNDTNSNDVGLLTKNVPGTIASETDICSKDTENEENSSSGSSRCIIGEAITVNAATNDKVIQTLIDSTPIDFNSMEAKSQEEEKEDVNETGASSRSGADHGLDTLGLLKNIKIRLKKLDLKSLLHSSEKKEQAEVQEQGVVESNIKVERDVFINQIIINAVSEEIEGMDYTANDKQSEKERHNDSIRSSVEKNIHVDMVPPPQVKASDVTKLHSDLVSPVPSRPSLEKVSPAAQKTVVKSQARVLCWYCDQRFWTIGELFKHVQQVHSQVTTWHNLGITSKIEITPNVWGCTECDVQYYALRDFLRHVRSEHFVQKKRFKKKHYILCETCGKLTNGYHHHKIHMRQHTGERPFQCEYCENTYASCSQRNFHVKKVHKKVGKRNFLCQFCGKSYVKADSLRYHESRHLGGEPRKTCSFCCQKFTDSKKYEMHVLHAHDPATYPQCNFPGCGKRFVKKQSLVEHERIHTKEQPIECKVCLKRFAHSAAYYVHQRVHTGVLPYKCSLCSLAFSQQYSRVRHMKTHKTGETLFNCDQCSNVYRSIRDLNRHVRNIHEIDSAIELSKEKEALLGCDYCSATYRTKRGLNEHLLTHPEAKALLEKDGEKQKKIPTVKKVAKISKKLDRKFKCLICSKFFKTEAGLWKHEDTHDKMEDSDEEEVEWEASGDDDGDQESSDDTEEEDFDEDEQDIKKVTKSKLAKAERMVQSAKTTGLINEDDGKGGGDMKELHTDKREKKDGDLDNERKEKRIARTQKGSRGAKLRLEGRSKEGDDSDDYIQEKDCDESGEEDMDLNKEGKQKRIAQTKEGDRAAKVRRLENDERSEGGVESAGIQEKSSDEREEEDVNLDKEGKHKWIAQNKKGGKAAKLRRLENGQRGKGEDESGVIQEEGSDESEEEDLDLNNQQTKKSLAVNVDSKRRAAKMKRTRNEEEGREGDDSDTIQEEDSNDTDEKDLHKGTDRTKKRIAQTEKRGRRAAKVRSLENKKREGGNVTDNIQEEEFFESVQGDVDETKKILAETEEDGRRITKTKRLRNGDEESGEGDVEDLQEKDTDESEKVDLEKDETKKILAETEEKWRTALKIKSFRNEVDGSGGGDSYHS